MAVLLLAAPAPGAFAEAAGEGIELRVTLTTDPPPACGEATELDVVAGAQVNYCFTVVNHTGQTLTRHSLNNDQYSIAYPPPNDPFFSFPDLGGVIEGEIPPGGTLRHYVVVTAGADRTASFIWGASAGEPRYVYSTAPAAFEDISTFGTLLTTPADTYITPQPFPFVLYGLPTGHFPSEGICVRRSGTVQLLRGFEPCYGFSLITEFMADNLEPQIPDAGNALMAFWDWLLQDSGLVYRAVLGQAPNRRLVVQWDRWQHVYSGKYPGWDCIPGADSDGITFQIILEEGTGRVRYAYKDVEFGGAEPCGWEHGASATVGLAGFSRLPQDYFSANQPLLADGLEITWTPTIPTYVAEAQTRLAVGGSPYLIVNPSAIEAPVVAGGSGSRPLVITNAGTFRLQWALDRASAKSHFPRTKRVVPPVGDPVQTRSLPPAQPVAFGTFDYGSAQPKLGATPFPASFGEGAVPAYATKTEVGRVPYGGRVETTRNVTLNVADPSYLTWTGLGDTSYVYAGDFVDDDFARQYVFAHRASEYGFETLDTATGAVTFVGLAIPTAVHPWDELWSGLSWDRASRTLFAASSACASGPGPSGLYRIDPATAALTFIGRIHVDGADVCIGDIAVAPDGAMYGIDQAGDSLIAIDKTTGEAAVIGSVGFDLNYKNSMDFDDVSGALYLAAYTDFEGDHGGMHTLDLATGAATRIAPFPRMPESQWLYLSGLAIARAGGACAYPGEIPWLSTDAVEGTVDPGEDSIVTVTLDATSLAPGRYDAHLCVRSNDRARSLKALPIGLTVTDGETIFADSFESPAR